MTKCCIYGFTDMKFAFEGKAMVTLVHEYRSIELGVIQC
jgi:hypothetical protein